MQLDVHFQRAPSALAYMARAFHRSPGLRLDAGLPPLQLTWHGVRAEQSQLAEFAAFTGIEVDGSVPILYPHVVGFRLAMALLTHPAYPLPIWRALQIRNHLVQHEPLPVDQPFDLSASIAAHRVLDKGLEVDLRTTASAGDTVAWESLVTFYYRGRFGAAGAPSPLAAAPDGGAEELARWHTGAGSGVRFGRLCGDYNGIHLWSPYARLFGFPRAFHHPQRVLGQCMARVPAPDPRQPQRLDAWLKGPVCYGAEVILRARGEANAITFALFADGDVRPAISGRWSVIG